MALRARLASQGLSSESTASSETSRKQTGAISSVVVLAVPMMQTRLAQVSQVTLC